ncbi:YALI0E20097p [Yarrowia lipolytica CLIB122]|uniref:YALI0E20097p n=1 Tax=Yarrowia lipolytica (strain CLIB 122 / E 150) TaxID=284591 RepID=Q6C589_YARLI|nr:YALI0E20097p [Yarrowia lipolytica CLIB122]CAG79768.1 YALI0E20097p [Yarrowia lipolytica CLIB122]|eukprot:XP_504173.1 YALI0E20097p [Yarrowia lipolytica CLIB122]
MTALTNFRRIIAQAELFRLSSTDSSSLHRSGRSFLQGSQRS